MYIVVAEHVGTITKVAKKTGLTIDRQVP